LACLVADCRFEGLAGIGQGLAAIFNPLTGGYDAVVEPTRGLLRYFDRVPDPRAANVSFSLASLLAMTLLAEQCRCDDCEGIADWAAARAGWLATFLGLPAPSRSRLVAGPSRPSL